MSFITLDERIGTEKLVRASELLKVAAHPQRLAILDLLGGKKRMCVSDLVEVLGIEQQVTRRRPMRIGDRPWHSADPCRPNNSPPPGFHPTAR